MAKVNGESKYVVAAKKWEELLETRYSDMDILGDIADAEQAQSLELALSLAQTALAKVQYNRMIEERVRSAQRSWGMKV